MAANQQTQLKPDLPPLSLQGRIDILGTFQKAARQFVHEEDDQIEIWAASKDWFLEEWGRDTFISLPGLLIATGKLEKAKNNIRHFASYEREGLIPNRIEQDGDILYNTADAPMWFIQAIQRVTEAEDSTSFAEEMLSVIQSIVNHYRQGAHYQRYGQKQRIFMDPDDGLIHSPAQATWMDADAWGDGEFIITPRDGKAVEINALWYANLRFLADLIQDQKLHQLADQVKTSFNDKFWNAEEHCLLDVIEGDPHGKAIRPNQVFAGSHGGDLLPPDRKKAVFECLKRELLTAGGLRTLSPRDSHYIGHYDTDAPMSEKDQAYHQGTIWPWLIGPYCDLLVNVRRQEKRSEDQIRQELEQVLTPLVTFCLESEYKSLPEVFSGDPPHEPGGTRSQAWSVAEGLRILLNYHLIS